MGNVYNKGLSYYYFSKQMKMGGEKVKNSFHVKEIHRVTLHLVSNALNICISLQNSILNLIAI
jgi:hypothetical protein